MVLCLFLKVQDFDKYHFKPGELVKNIASMIVNLGSECDFCRAVATDGRSYSPKLYQEAMKVLKYVLLLVLCPLVPFSMTILSPPSNEVFTQLFNV